MRMKENHRETSRVGRRENPEARFQDIAERIAELAQILPGDQRRLYMEAIKTKANIQLDDKWAVDLHQD